ncbi:MAG: hypothetical protein AAGA90_15605 [Actinomycetota bacterium]
MGGDATASGVAAGAELIAFAEAAVRGEPLDDVRAAVIAAVGADGAGQAAATIAAFSGLVRVADGTGIPIDDGLAAASSDIRDELGLNDFRGAHNTDLDRIAAGGFQDIDRLWRD